MISYEEAIAKVGASCPKPRLVKLPISKALSHVLAEDVVSKIDDPPFDKTAVDGYALCGGELLDGYLSVDQAFHVQGAVAAGDHALMEITDSNCSRIFTGAMCPPGTDTVVMQEHVRAEGDRIVLERTVKQGANIRRKGEQIRKGEIALSKGTYLNSAAISYLAGLGEKELQVYAKVSVGILVTGDEFAQDFDDLERGKIFDANGPLLEGMLGDMGIEYELLFCKDDPALMLESFKALSDKNDFVIVTGGVSVGDHDHTPQIIEQAGYEIIFHKVQQKPGKPMLFAQKREKLAFGLPGNPLSVFVCFELYVRPAILQVSEMESNVWADGILAHDHQNKSTRREFALCYYENGKIHLIKDRASHMLKGLVHAQGLCILDGERSWKAGEMLKTMKLA